MTIEKNWICDKAFEVSPAAYVFMAKAAVSVVRERHPGLSPVEEYEQYYGGLLSLCSDVFSSILDDQDGLVWALQKVSSAGFEEAMVMASEVWRELYAARDRGEVRALTADEIIPLPRFDGLTGLRTWEVDKDFERVPEVKARALEEMAKRFSIGLFPIKDGLRGTDEYYTDPREGHWGGLVKLVIKMYSGFLDEYAADPGTIDADFDGEQGEGATLMSMRLLAAAWAATYEARERGEI